MQRLNHILDEIVFIVTGYAVAAALINRRQQLAKLTFAYFAGTLTRP